MDYEARKRKRLKWRIVRYIITVLTILTIFSVLILVLVGYRFNHIDGTIRQGGLVQFISQPNGASVTVGTAKLVDKTRSKITLIPGDYLVKMELSGYRLWQKNISVEAGKVLWLNSAHFVPRDITTETLKTFPTLADTTTRPGGKYITVLKDKAKPVLTKISIDGDTISQTTITVPSDVLAKAKKQTFSFLPWTSDDRHVLLEHSYGKLSEVLFVDTEDETKTVTIPSIGKVQPKEILPDPRNNSNLIARYSDGSVRLVNGGTGIVSSSILDKTTSIDTVDSAVVFAQRATKNEIAAGYLSLDNQTPRIIASYPSKQPVRLQIQKYFGVYFVTTSVGKDITIQKMIALPSSASSDPLTSENITSFTLQSSPLALQSKSGGRYLMISEAQSMTNYDLELGKLTTTPIMGANKQSTSIYDWLDSQHFWTDTTGSLRQYEYDGANQNDIVSVAKGFSAVYSPNDKYLYSIGKTQSGYTLQRSTMIVNK